MKIAIVCDDLIQRGGAEKVFLDICSIYPKADVYTTVASKRWKNKCKKQNINLKTSFLDKFPFAVKLNRLYSVFLLHVFAIESFDFSSYDLVFSLSSRYAHFAITKPKTRHVCYMHSPGRMFWESTEYFSRENINFVFLSLPLSIIRLLDFGAAQRVDKFIANSQTSKNRIQKYYKRTAVVINPGFEKVNYDIKDIDEEFYLILTRLVGWKHVEIAVKAFNENGKNLKIIGLGPDKKRLQNMAKRNIEFLGYHTDEGKWDLIKNARAVIITQKEDFGIVPLEAMSMGTPVIGFGEGGVTETVINGETGLFFSEQNAISLNDAINKFETMRFDSELLIKNANKFSKEVFKSKIKQV